MPSCTSSTLLGPSSISATTSIRHGERIFLLDLRRYTSLEFDRDLLTFYVNVLLAQAQEALVEKSLIDHRSNVVVARLAVYLRDLYQVSTTFPCLAASGVMI